MIKLSIIIVAYKEFDCVSRCLASIPQEPWIEVLIVNNSVENRGFGAGCNVGARLARGDVLLFLNPDSVSSSSLNSLVDSVMDRRDVGLWGYRLTDETGVGVPSISKQPSLPTAPFLYSGLAKRLRHVSWVRNLWFDWKVPKKQTEVGVVSGAVMAIQKDDFETVGGFDERFFLYWEEVDLARRVLAMGKKVLFNPAFSFVHSGGLSTDSKQKALQWYRENRYRFFAKHFGSFYGLLLEGWFTLLSEWRLVLGITFFVAMGIWVFFSNWWMQPIAAAWWYQLPWWHYGISPALGMVFGTASLVATIVLWYNEAWWLSGNKRIVWGLIIGFFGLLVALPVGILGLLVALVWIVLDLHPRLLFWRRSLVFVWIGGLLVSIGMYVCIQLKNPPSPLNWPVVMEYVMSRYPVDSISLSCLECESNADLLLGRLWLDRMGIGGQSANDLDARTVRIYIGNLSALERIKGIAVGGAVISYSGNRL